LGEYHASMDDLKKHQMSLLPSGYILIRQEEDNTELRSRLKSLV
jgi:hypothetical protein